METRRKIIWAPSALKDLQESAEFIAADNPKAAERWVQTVLKLVKKLDHFPKLGRTIPELESARYRELVESHYRIFHEVTDREIRIFRILHSRRRFPD